MALPDLPTKEQLAKLPRLAIVAFAARCARRVEPLFQNSELASVHKAALSKAISFPERYAAANVDIHAIADAAAYTEYAEKAIDDDDNDNDYTYNAARAARAAVRSTLYVAGAADAAAKAAANAADAADAAARAAADAADAIVQDFTLLQDKASTAGWTDDTPVPPTVFGEMWPDGVPEWSLIKQPLQTSSAFLSGEYALAFDLWIDPGQASKDTLQEVLITLSELHIAAGGSGLKFIPDGEFIHVREFEPA